MSTKINSLQLSGSTEAPPLAEARRMETSTATNAQRSRLSRRETTAALATVLGTSVLTGCNGQGAPLDDNRVQWCDTYAELRALTGGATSTAKNVTVVRGTTSALQTDFPKQGGGGVFVWSTDTTTPDNGGTIIAANTGRTGCWLRLYDGALSLTWFGAVGDGITDDTPAFAMALAAAAGKTLVIPAVPNYYRLTDKVVIFSGTTIAGIGRPKIAQATPGKILLYGNAVSDVSIQGLALRGADITAPTDSAQWGLITIEGTSSNVRINDNEVHNTHNGITVGSCQNLWIENNVIHDWLLYGILASTSWNYHIDGNILYDNLQTGAPSTGDAKNAYGIQATSDSTLFTDQKQNSICFNEIDGVPAWDGIMSHEAVGLVITGNSIRNCRTGIDLGLNGSAELNEIIVSSNHIQLTSTETRGGMAGIHGGILVSGASTIYADRIVIIGNLIHNANNIPGYTPSGNVVGCIGLDTVRNAIVSGNVMTGIGSVFASFCAVFAYNVGDGINISGNHIQGSPDAAFRIQQATSGSSINALSITGNTHINSAPSSHLDVLLYNGTFNGLGLVNNMSNGTVPLATAGTIVLNFGTPLTLSGNGSPEGVLSAPVGALYTRLDGGATTTLYVKTSGSGSTGWTAK